MQTTILSIFSVSKSDMDRKLADAISEFTKMVEKHNGTITSVTPNGNISKVFLGYEQSVIVLHTANVLNINYKVNITRDFFTGLCVKFN
ncbi:MAG: hypothetical protein K2J47_05390 [Ruminococcus sp.]|nr:hypothetical protein [Ruminococcus sp.]